MSRTRLAWLSAILLLAACGGKGSSAGGPIKLSFGFSVPAGSERTQCYVVKLHNAKAIDFSHVESHMVAGSHHFILYRDASDLVGSAPPAEGIGDCDMETPRLFVYAAQEADHADDMPPGIAGELPPDSTVILEAHYVNASTSPIDAKASVEVDPVDPATITNLAGMLFYLDTDFAVPPGAGMNGNPDYEHSTTCAVPEAPGGTHIFRMGSHQHKRGLDVQVFQEQFPSATATTGADMSMVFENTDWESPSEESWPDAAPLTLEANQGLRFSCSWKNETGSDLVFGPSANDNEMCIIGAGYWPAVSGPYNLGGNVICYNGQIYY